MTDVMTNQRLVVLADDPEWPYLIVLPEQVERISSILRRHTTRFWTNGATLSINGGPATMTIDFGRGTRPDDVQRWLDLAE